MEAAGAVFFPASGCRASGTSIGSVGEFGGYYTSSNVNDNNVYNMSFGTTWAGPDGIDTRCYGRSVRLVRSALEQDSDGYYLIGSVDDWKDFATLVQTNPTANAKMTADINLGADQTMIGSLSVPYAGIFDGQGYTLTVAYNQSDIKEGIGPFYVLGAATIQNLHVDGSMLTRCGIGGIAGIVKGNATIQRCWVSATLQSNGYNPNPRGTLGGICSVLEGVDDAHLIIEDCLFDGTIVDNEFCGGFMSHVERASCSVTMRRGLNIGTYPTTTNENGTFIREVLSGVRNLEASTLFHKKVFGKAQGTQVTDEQLASGAIAYNLQANRTDLVWGQRLGTDAEPVLTNDESYRVYKSKNGGYTNNPEDAYMGLQQDGEGNYLLSNLLDWQEFAELVQTTPTANAKMTADIDLGEDQTMIGSNNTYPYSGIFDGQGHTLTVAYNNTDAGLYVAPFSYIYGATIRNLHVAGTIQTACQNAGVVSKYGGSGNVVENVWSSLAIQTNWTVNGGIWECCSGLIGSTLAGTNASLIMRDCLFTGSVVATSGDQSGCFMGYVDTGCSANVSNCLSVGTYSYTATNSSVTRDRMSIDNSFVKQFPNTIPAAMQLTNERLADGSIAYKLQNNRTDLVWGQRIGIDAEPVLTNDESYRVYKSKNGGYTNNPEEAMQQDGEGYFLLGSLQDWRAFAELINSGMNTANAKMTADINLGDDQTMIGLGSVDGRYGDGNLLYTGIFDGQGHTLTINYVANERFVAPFRHIQDATIKNLRVTGTIATSEQFTGGIVGACYGEYRDNYITNCISSVNIVSSWVNTEDTHINGSLIGGIVGKLCYYNRLHISDCIFNGSISGENRTVVWGGFVGLPDGTIIVRNSLLTAEFDCTNVLVGTNGAGTFSSVFGGGYASTIDIDASNYYLNALGSVQGTQATAEQLADGTIATALQAGRAEEIWVQDGTMPMLKIFATTPIEAITANEDPDHAGVYYSTFYDSAKKYALPNDGTEAYAAEVNDGAMYLHKIAEGNDVLPAGTAVIFKATSGTITLTESDDAPVAISVSNHLHGVDVDTEISSVVTGTCYVLSGGSNGVGFYLYEYPNQLKAHKAYIDLNGGGAAQAPKHLRFVFDSATAIETTEANVKAEKRIENGVLYIIKNGVKYNAQGQTVK